MRSSPVTVRSSLVKKSVHNARLAGRQKSEACAQGVEVALRRLMRCLTEEESVNELKSSFLSAMNGFTRAALAIYALALIASVCGGLFGRLSIKISQNLADDLGKKGMGGFGSGRWSRYDTRVLFRRATSSTSIACCYKYLALWSLHDVKLAVG